MARKNDNYYYEMLVNGVEYSCKASVMLNEALQNFRPETMQQSMKDMHEIEHAGDFVKHDMMSRLVKEFITPIEREDIIDLAQAIDDVTDSIEDVLMRMYMFNIKNVRSEALGFCTVIVSCCTAMKIMMEEFYNFKKSSTIQEMVININNLEEEGDKLYTDAMRNLYANSNDAIEIVAWTEIFDRLEKCCDKCEDVANGVESVIMKNS